MLQTKDYIVIDDETKHVLYSGYNAFKAHQAFFSSLPNTKHRVKFKGIIQRSYFNCITALSERLN